MIYVHVSMCMYLYIYICVCICKYVYMCVYASVCICDCVSRYWISSLSMACPSLGCCCLYNSFSMCIHTCNDARYSQCMYSVHVHTMYAMCSQFIYTYTGTYGYLLAVEVGEDTCAILSSYSLEHSFVYSHSSILPVVPMLSTYSVEIHALNVFQLRF